VCLGGSALATLGTNPRARPIYQKLLEFEVAIAEDRDVARYR
jgi:hypothetical protein